MTASIHPSAFVHPRAELGVDVEIGPSAYVGPDVVIGARTRLLAGACVYGLTTLGCDNVVFPHAVLGSDPQDLSYRGEPTRLEVGDGNHFRECVTVNRGTVKGGGLTRVGHRNLFMACSHVAHDCELGSDNVIANNVLFAGHVCVENGAVINGAAAFHHFVTVGSLAYVGGMSRVVHDVPPFMKAEGDPARVRAVNTVGMRRRGRDPGQIEEIENLHRRLYRSSNPLAKVLAGIDDSTLSEDGRQLVVAVRRTLEGVHGRWRERFRTDRREGKP